MSQTKRAIKRHQSQERIKTFTRDLHRHQAIQELMRRDPLGAQLTQLIVQRYKGYSDTTTIPALEKYGLYHDKVIHFVQQLYGPQPEGDARAALEAELASCCDALCQKYRITALHITRPTLIEEVKSELVTGLLDNIHGTSPLSLDANQIAGHQEQFAQAFGVVAAYCWGPRKGWKTFQYARNWIPADTYTLRITPEGVSKTRLAEQAPPPGEPPTLTITIDLLQVTRNDLNRLTWEFKEVVKKSLKKSLQALPTSRITDHHAVESALSSSVHGIPSTQSTTPRPTLTVVLDCSRVNQWYLKRLGQAFKAILRAACAQVDEEAFERKLFRWDEFVRDVRRYDWHMQAGLSFREIAFQELMICQKARQQGQTLEEPLALPTPLITRDDMTSLPRNEDPYALKPKYKAPIQSEDSVAQGIKNIYYAIHRCPYPVPGMEPNTTTLNRFQCRCPYHPHNDCPEDCLYAGQWLKSVRKLLPTNYGGGGREVPVSNTLLDARRRAKVLQAIYGEQVYGALDQNENGDEILVDDQTSELLLDAFEDHVYLGCFSDETVGDDDGLSAEAMDYLAPYECDEEGYLEYPDELQ